MTVWFWLGFAAGVALGLLANAARGLRWRRREAYRAHVQAIAIRRQLADAARSAHIDVRIMQGRS